MTRMKYIRQAHGRMIAVKVHPDQNSTLTPEPVCDAANRAEVVRVNDARDELLSSVPWVGSHPARPAANSEDQAYALWEFAEIVRQLIFVAVAFNLIKLFYSATCSLNL